MSTKAALYALRHKVCDHIAGIGNDAHRLDQLRSALLEGRRGPWHIVPEPNDADLWAFIRGERCNRCTIRRPPRKERHTTMTDTTPAEATESHPAHSTGTTGESHSTVAIGDHVSYVLSDYDVKTINANDPAGNNRNTAHSDHAYPALVTAVFSQNCVNLRVHLDGAGPGADYWATSRQRGTAPSHWHA